MPLRRDACRTKPANPYAASKAAAEAVLIAAHQCYGIEAIVARSFNHIGPGQDERFAVASFAAGLARVAAGRERILWIGNVETERDFLDVRATWCAPTWPSRSAAGPARSTTSAAAPRPACARYCGDSSSLSRRALQSRSRGSRAHAAPSDIPRSVGDSSKLREETGWSPEIRLDDSLRAVYEAAREAVLAGAGKGAP